MQRASRLKDTAVEKEMKGRCYVARYAANAECQIALQALCAFFLTHTLWSFPEENIVSICRVNLVVLCITSKVMRQRKAVKCHRKQKAPCRYFTWPVMETPFCC